MKSIQEERIRKAGRKEKIKKSLKGLKEVGMAPVKQENSEEACKEARKS
jgi:hypothetical protein